MFFALFAVLELGASFRKKKNEWSIDLSKINQSNIYFQVLRPGLAAY